MITPAMGYSFGGDPLNTDALSFASDTQAQVAKAVVPASANGMGGGADIINNMIMILLTQNYEFSCATDTTAMAATGTCAYTGLSISSFGFTSLTMGYVMGGFSGGNIATCQAVSTASNTGNGVAKGSLSAGKSVGRGAAGGWS